MPMFKHSNYLPLPQVSYTRYVFQQYISFLQKAKGKKHHQETMQPTEAEIHMTQMLEPSEREFKFIINRYLDEKMDMDNKQYQMGNFEAASQMGQW